VTQQQAEGTAGENVEVVDVALLLLEAVRRGDQAGSDRPSESSEQPSESSDRS